MENVSAFQGIDGFPEWELEKMISSENNFLWKNCQSATIAVAACVAYVTVVFGGQKYMKNRPAFELRKYLSAWSTCLAVFSILGTLRCAIVVRNVYAHGGVKGLVCTDKNYHERIVRFWAVCFTISKIVELGDTIFIVFRKQKLTFLHWYHHVTVLLYCWHCYGGRWAGGLVFMPVNFLVHAMMYTYYAIRARGFKLPKFISIIVTSCQIAQMFIGVATMVGVAKWGTPTARECHTSDRHLWSGFAMYTSYLVLFVNFFYRTYVAPRQRIASVSKVDDKKTDAVDSNQQKSDENDQTRTPYNLRKRQ